MNSTQCLAHVLQHVLSICFTFLCIIKSLKRYKKRYTTSCKLIAHFSPGFILCSLANSHPIDKRPGWKSTYRQEIFRVVQAKNFMSNVFIDFLLTLTHSHKSIIFAKKFLHVDSRRSLLSGTSTYPFCSDQRVLLIISAATPAEHPDHWMFQILTRVKSGLKTIFYVFVPNLKRNRK